MKRNDRLRNNLSWLIVVIFFQVNLFLLSEYLLLEDSLYYDFFGDKLSYERIAKLILDGKKWKWLSYVLIPLLTLLKCFCLAVCFYAGAFFIRVENKFSDFFRLAVLAEFIVFVPIIIKIIWFGFIHRNYTLEDLTYFFPLSILNLFDRTELDTWLIYPLQLLNVFEVIYWLLLAYLLKELIGKSFIQRLGFVASTYGVGLFIWVLFVTFLTVSLS